MNGAIIAIVVCTIVILAGLVGVAFFVNKNKPQENNNNEEWLEQNTLHLRDIHAELTKIEQIKSELIKSQVNEENLLRDMKSLKYIFEGTVDRGRSGENILGYLLNNMFGGNDQIYKKNKVIESGLRPDFALKLEKTNVYIDSKFPFDESERKPTLLKKVLGHAKELTKYISSDNDFVILFLPSDSIYDIITTDQETMVNIYNLKIILASPANIAMILLVFQKLYYVIKQVNNYTETMKAINKLYSCFYKFGDNWDKYAKHVSNFNKKFDDIQKDVNKINKSFEKVITSNKKQEEKK